MNIKKLLTWLTAGVVAISVSGSLAAQDFTVPYNKAPETIQEFWAAAKYDLSLGNHARAAQMLANYYDKIMAYGEEEQKKYFLNLYDTEGISPLLRLGTIPAVKAVLRKDPESNTDRPAVEILIARMTKFIEARLSDPERIRFFVNQLNKRPEERAYAISQLKASGPRSIPPMLDVLRDPAQQAMHGAIFNALLKMDNDIGPPLLAALDSKSDFIKGTIVDVFAQRADNRIVPDLYHLSQAASSTPALQEKAKEWLMRFLFKTEKEITDAKEQLVATSDSYHQHKVNLDGQKLHVWKWDDQEGLTGTPATKSQVEEALGVAYARKALDLDPSYRPAQVQLLSVALDKLYENAGPNVSVAEVNPNLQALLAGSPADLLEEVLAKALRDNKPSAALGAIRALGIHGDPRVLSFSERGSPPLLQALRYPDRRVRFAAAEAALAINSKGEAYPGSSRVLEVLKHAATGYGTQRILIGLGNREEANKLADQLRLLQYDVSVFGSGRQLLSEAASHGNVGLIIVDAALPDPGFSYFLAQYKNQPNTSGMPMLVIADKDQGRFASDSLAKQPNVKVIASVPQSQALIDSEVKSMLSDKTKPAISDAEREAQAKAAVDYLARMAKGELGSFDMNSSDATLIRVLGKEALAPAAATALSFRPSREAQLALAGKVTSDDLTPATRASLAASLRAHIQRFGNQLPQDQVKTLLALSEGVSDSALRQEVDLILSSIRGDTAAVGNRLKSYVPATATPATKVEPGTSKDN